MRLAAKMGSFGVIGALAFLFANTHLVHVDASRKSRFIQSYDASIGVNSFGHIRQSSASAENAAGRHGVWNSRDIFIHIAVDETRLPALLDAMEKNVRDTLSRTGSRFVGVGIAEATYIESDTKSQTSPEFIVPVWIEEQWVPN